MKKRSVLQFGLYCVYTALVGSLLAATNDNKTSTSAALKPAQESANVAKNTSTLHPTVPKGAVVLASSGPIYMLGKSNTRARIARARAAQREAAAAAAARRQTNQTAQATNNSASPVQTGQPNNSVAPAFVSPTYSPVVLMPTTSSTNEVGRIEKPQDEGPKAQPIAEVSGPLFDDKDPLFNYQREQAVKGNPESEFALGIRFLNGVGVPQDDKLAREWLEKAAAHGNLRARAKLHELDNRRDF